jgi:hypothetical protein
MATEANTATVDRIGLEAHALAERVTALAEARERSDVAAFVRDVRARQRTTTATIVVVGETKRGKSSFVNALLGADVSPVDADVATSVFLLFRYGREPSAWLHLANGAAPRRVPIDSAREWATVAGNPDNAKNVRALEILLPSPPLARGLNIIDTPGTGGLDASHREVTLAALRQADALLFVMDTDAPLSVPEYRFLREATKRINTVLFALTKVDAALSWEAIARANRRAIATHAPEYEDAPLLPVSSVDKRDADIHQDESLLETSGFPAVERALEEIVIARTDVLRIGNLVRSVTTAVDELERADRNVQSMPAKAPELSRARDEARAQQHEYGRLTEAWASKLALEYQRDVRHELEIAQRRSLQRLLARYEGEIRAGRVDPVTLSDDLETELRAIAMELQAMLNDAVARLVGSLAMLYRVRPDELLAATAQEGFSLIDLPEIPTISQAPAFGFRRAATALSAVGLGALSGGKWSLLLGPQAAMIGAGVGGLLGGVTWQTTARRQRRIQEQQEGAALLRSAVDAARLEIEAHLRSRVLTLQSALQDELKTLIGRRRRQLAADVQQYERRIAATAEQLRADRERAEARLRETAPLRADAAVLEERLASCKAGGSP